MIVLGVVGYALYTKQIDLSVFASRSPANTLPAASPATAQNSGGQKPAESGGTSTGKPADGAARSGPPSTAQPGTRGPTPVETAKAVSSRLTDDIYAIGNLLADESVAIAPETSGRVAEILFQDGDTVKGGQPLFKLDPELANAALVEARAKQALAQATYDRSQTLRRSGTAAQSTFDAANTDLQLAASAVATAEVMLKKLTVSAPFSGTLGFRKISLGAYVNAGTVLVQLDKIDTLKVSFAVPELEQKRIEVGQMVELTADAVPGETFLAKIIAIEPSIDVNGRALQVRAALDNANLHLRPGLLVRVQVKGPERQAIVVPEAALIQRTDDAVVYLVKDKAAQEVKVQVGKRTAGTIEVIGSIAEGSDVVVAGATRLANGAKVEVVPPAKAAE